jgi:hypothetical protein
MRKVLSTAIAVLALAAAAPAQAVVTYTLTFEGADLRDYTQMDPVTLESPVIGTFGGGFVIETPLPVDAQVALPTVSCSLTSNATALYDCTPTHEFIPDAFGLGFSLISFGTLNTDNSGGSGGFLFFDALAFLADGIYDIVNPGQGFGNFATSGTLTVTGISTPVAGIPEPASLAMLGIGLLGLAASRRRR